MYAGESLQSNAIREGSKDGSIHDNCITACDDNTVMLARGDGFLHVQGIADKFLACIAGQDKFDRGVLGHVQRTEEEELLLNTLVKKFRKESRDMMSLEREKNVALLPFMDHCLLKHARDPLMSSTMNGSNARVYSWIHYCLWRYACHVPSLKQSLEEWPPSQREWEAFILWTRARVSSFDACRWNYGNVCTVATEYWAQREGQATARNPRRLYRQAHFKVLKIIRREENCKRKQVLAITMEEARNVPHFLDGCSLLGLMQRVCMDAGLCVRW